MDDLPFDPANLFLMPLLIVVYCWVRIAMTSTGRDASAPTWRDITVIDVVCVIVIGTIFIR